MLQSNAEELNSLQSKLIYTRKILSHFSYCWQKKRGRDMITVDQLCYQVVKGSKGQEGFALKNISFVLEKGYIMGVLGKNGSGKSSLLRLLYGMERSDSGSVFWEGQDIHSDLCAFRQKTAYIASDSGFFHYRSLEENVELLGYLYDHFDRNHLNQYLEQYGLETKMDSLYGMLSTGEQRKFQLAFAMAHQPELLILDELTANLDSVFRTELMEVLQDLVAKEETSVILSTHILSDIDEIVDYIAILKAGELVLFGDRESITEQQGSMELEDLFLSVI